MQGKLHVPLAGCMDGPPCFPPSSTWRVPDQQPGDQQGASQAQAVAGTGSFLLSFFPLSGCLAASSLGQRPAPLRGASRPSYPHQKATALLDHHTRQSPRPRLLPRPRSLHHQHATKALCKRHRLHTLLSHKHGSKALFARQGPRLRKQQSWQSQPQGPDSVSFLNHRAKEASDRHQNDLEASPAAEIPQPVKCFPRQGAHHLSRDPPLPQAP